MISNLGLIVNLQILLNLCKSKIDSIGCDIIF